MQSETWASEQVRKAKHLIAVGQETPKELELAGNVEMDSMSGGRLRSTSYANPDPVDAVEAIRSLLLEAMESGKRRATLIMDAAHQFSVSVGVYVDDSREAVRFPDGAVLEEHIMPRIAGTLTRSQLAARGLRFVLKQVVHYPRGSIGKVIALKTALLFKTGFSENHYTIVPTRSFRLRWVPTTGLGGSSLRPRPQRSHLLAIERFAI